MKKIVLPMLIVLMTFFIVGCSSPDKKLFRDTAVLLTDSNEPPQVSFSANIPSSLRVGENFIANFTYENIGGGSVKLYVNRYKNNENLIKYGCDFSGVFKNGIKSGGDLDAFDFNNNATYETANVKCGPQKSFLSPGTYKYDFVFYNCTDLINKLGASKDCDGFSVGQEDQGEFSAKGVEPIKVESYQVIVN